MSALASQSIVDATRGYLWDLDPNMLDAGARDTAPKDDQRGADLVPGRVQVWRVRVPVHGAELQALSSILDAEERRRAGRIVLDPVRDLFITSHAALRCLISQVVGTDARAVQIRQQGGRKPRLEGSAAGSGLRFNLSHSGSVALVAMSVDREVGVDVEEIRTGLPISAIAERFFSMTERAAIERRSGDEREEAFFRCFCRKEAFAKALGEGLRLPFESFSTPSVCAGPLRGPERARLAGLLGKWRIFDLDPAPGYVGSVVVSGRVESLVIRDWTGVPDGLATP